MACWGQLEFSEAISPVMQDFLYFHDHVMLVLIFILSYVGFMMISTLKNKTLDVFLLENQMLEVFWTLFPVFILLYIGAPSLYILYSMDYDYLWLSNEDFFNIKITGHQWYWSYNEMFNSVVSSKSASESINFDSYMAPTNELKLGEFRLLEVDNRLILPCEMMIKFYVTAADVLHSWTIPAMGVKLDACPGRLNQAITFLTRPGVFYGQCSEICGANHSFMPICVEARVLEEFLSFNQINYN